MASVVQRCFSLPLLFRKKQQQPAILSLSSNHSIKTKTKRRSNHLRYKLLKSLTPKPSSSTSTSIIITPHQHTNTKEKKEEEETNSDAVTFSQEISSDVGRVLNHEFGKHWVFKLCFYLLSLLLFQTVCAIWVFGSHDIAPEDRKDSVFEDNPTKRSNLLSDGDSPSEKNPSVLLTGNGNLGTIDMEERLSEIQAMARKVREGERSKAKADEEVDGGVARTGIEREVNNRLLYIQDKLESVVRKPAIPVSEKDDGLGGKGKRTDPLMFKKKYMFRSPSISLGDKPKGFTGTKDYGVNKSGNGVLAAEDEINVLGKAMMQNKSVMGATQDERLQAKAGQWWHRLPYVMAVMMGSEDGGEGPIGLFTLQGNPYSKDDDDLSSHLVAFEDRGDANNFCYILESFFEDLGDFRAIIVPLSVKDLEREVKTHSKEVVVVKKGQLKLYAGQPLAEVETALRSLVEKAR